MKNRSTLSQFLIGLFCLVSSAVIGQTTRFVSTTGTNSDPASATSWATATTDLQGAINSLTATGGEVWVAGGVYKPTQGTDRSVNWVLPPNVDLYGGFAGSETAVSDRPPINPTVGQYSSTTLSGDIGTPEDNSDNSNQLIFIQSGSGSLNTTSINGFVLTGANGLSTGGAIHSPTTQDITIANCYFYRNTSTYGGAFYHEPNSLNRIQISSCLFEENSGFNGGAIFAGAYRAIALNCIFRKNTANTGGAIYTFYFMNIWQCLFESNTATAGSGGAVNAWSGGANINAQNCSFVNNSATVDGGALTLITSASGGAGVARIQTCSFQGNRAGGSGGAILHNSDTSNPAVAPISNSVFFNNGGANTITNVSANPIPLNYNLAEAEVLSVTGLSTGTGNLIATSSPFASTTSNQLNPCSPAINSGDPSVTTNTVGRTDVTGQARFYNNGRVDMGAYEYQSDPTTITLTNPTVTTADVGVSFSQSFSASGGSTPYSYSLLSGSLPTGLTLSTDGALSGTPTQAGSFSVVVRATDNAGCQGDGTAYVLTVTSIALAGFDVSPDPICVGRPATFSATVSNVTGSYSYTLSNGSNPLSSTSTSPTLSQTLTATGSGTQTFTLTVAQSGYAANATTTLTVKNSPTANILVPSSSTLTCTTTSLALTATGGGSYRWDNNSTSATRTVTVSGTYSVTVTIPNGCSSIDNQIITSDTASSTATIQTPASTTLTCTTTSLALTATGGGSYHWDNNTTNAVRTVNASGTYSVTVTGSNGCTAIDSQTISSDVATPVLSLTATNGCSGQDVMLTASSGLTNYTFYGPSGVIQSGQTSSANISGLSAGIYSFSVAAQHLTSLCSTTATATATVSSLPSLTITASPSLTISSGNTVTLTASGAASYTWTGGTGDPFTASPASTTPYSVTGVNASGCSSSTTVTVTVNAPVHTVSIADFAPTLATVCTGQIATFTATIGNVTGAYDYTLTNGTSTTSGTTGNMAFSQNWTTGGYGVQSFSLIISSNGSSTTASTTLTVSSLPSLTITASPSLIITSGNAVTLTASGAASYTWTGGSTGTTLTVSPNSTTPYSVTGLTASGCNSTTSVTITVNEPVCYSVVYVTQTGAGLQNGSSWTNAYPGTMLQTAINSASSCSGQVWVAAGTYKPTTGNDRTISFAMVNSVTIVGGFVGNESSIASRTVTSPVMGNPSSSTLSGEIGDPTSLTDNSYHVISNPHGLTTSAVLDGFVITGGYANGTSPNSSGGGVINFGNGAGQYCNPSFRNCLFQSNSGSFGAAMNNYGNNSGDSSPVLTDCVFQSNTGAVGGAILNDANNGNSSPIINNCVFKSNTANTGGAIYNSGITGGNSSPTLNNCVFLSNSAKLYGGAIINLTNASGNCSPNLTNCLFQSNTATNTGGVMYNQAGTNCTCNPTLTNCAFLSNVASLSGGAFHNYVGTGTSNIVLTNCSFQSNSATNSGGLAYSEVGTGIYSFSLINCVLWNNGGNNTFNNSNGTISLAYSLFEASTLLSNTDTSSPGNLTTAISPFASTTSLQLNACAPAINTGSNAAFTGVSSLTTDLAGNPRFYNSGTVDMGSYEFQATPSAITLNNPGVPTATVGVAFSQTFTISNGTNPSTFTLLSGSLPTGLTLASSGVLSGTPTQSGTFTLVVQGTDAAGCTSAGSTYTLTVASQPPTLSGFASTASTVCTGQTTTFTATVGNVTGNYNFTLTNGTSTTTGTSSNTAFNQPWTTGGFGLQSFTLIISANGSLVTASTTLTVGSVISNAAINYWGGCISSDWHTASNWSKGTVPVATDDVVLLATAPNQPVLSGLGVAKSVEVPASTTLTISNSGTLTINGSRDFSGATLSLYNEGTVENSGSLLMGNSSNIGYCGLNNLATFRNFAGAQIRIDRSTTYGLLNSSGTFSNAGTITVGALGTVGSTGIYNLAFFTNSAGGLISINRSTSGGLSNGTSATFTNASTITIGETASVGALGLMNLGFFTNTPGGIINIDRADDTGISNFPAATFTNSATITIGASATIGQYGLHNFSPQGFNNAVGGLIRIDNTLSSGLLNSSEGLFTNSATITIGASTSVGQYGFYNLGGKFNNTTTGQINIDRASDAGLYNSSTTGTMTNSGTIAIGDLASAGQYGISNSASFTHTSGGLIRINNASVAGLLNSSGSGGQFTNSGTIAIGDLASVGQYGIQNQTTFNNTSGSQITIDRSSIAGLYNTATFSNSATITIGASANVGQYGLQNLFGTFTNTGGGQINIDRSSSGGLIHAGTFTNSATITIGANAAVGDIALGAAGSNGIGTFSNNAGGLITLAGSSIVGLDNYLSTFINAGTIRAGHLASVGQYGVRNRGFFTNTTGGSIHVDGATGTGLLNELGAFTNSSTILIGSVSAVGATGVSNGTATFNNSGCAALLKVVSDAVITNSVSGTFTNTGTIIENASGNSTISSNAGLVLNQNGGTFNTGTGPNQPLSSHTTSQTSCSPADGALTFSGLQPNTTYSFSYTVNGNATQVSPDPASNANGELILANLSGGVYSINLSGNCVAETLPLTATIASNTVPPSLTISSSNATLSCASPTVSLSAIGNGTVKWSTGELSSVINVTSGGTYSVTLTAGNGCSSTTSTSISSNTALVISAGASLPQANLGVVVSLTASGASSYQWSGPSTAQLTTPATGSAISVSLTTAGVQTFTIVGTTGACSQSALVSVTALAGPDLSAIMSLPDGNFQARESKGLLMQLQEVNGATASGSIMITITVPVGYSVSFDNSLTSINVSGGSNNPVAVQNNKWQISSSLAGQQLSLTLNGGESVAASSTINLGFSITRTTANSGSVSNITVNVADDGGGQYDVNRLNNVYARIITGL